MHRGSEASASAAAAVSKPVVNAP